ncbi:MAG: nitroreductase family protein [Elusimicrobia bacterium]|nr:nitroreductase family protein [Elusimicrobiota bacterium]
MKAEVAANPRVADHPIDEIFLERWSPRAMSGETISREELMSLFEAARWAPSSYNSQPWRFGYALRGTPHWQGLLDLLVDNNKAWAKNAGALIVIASDPINVQLKNRRMPTHTFDTGAAWMSIALEGHLRGLVVHGMEGFSYENAKKVLNLPEQWEVHAMAAVGRPGRKEDLPPALQEREFPNGRNPISSFIFEGRRP